MKVGRLDAALKVCERIAEDLGPRMRRVRREPYPNDEDVEKWFYTTKRDILKNKASHQSIADMRRIRMQRAGGSHTQAEFELVVWLFQNRCAYCWEETNLTEDHIIPIAHLGTSYIENIVPACRSCNARKGPKLFE